MQLLRRPVRRTRPEELLLRVRRVRTTRMLREEPLIFSDRTVGCGFPEYGFLHAVPGLVGLGGAGVLLQERPVPLSGILRPRGLERQSIAGRRRFRNVRTADVPIDEILIGWYCFRGTGLLPGDGINAFPLREDRSGIHPESQQLPAFLLRQQGERDIRTLDVAETAVQSVERIVRPTGDHAQTVPGRGRVLFHLL